MKHCLNKNTTGVFSGLLALLLVPLFFSGCNSGVTVLTSLLDDDEEENLTVAEGVSVVFEGFEEERGVSVSSRQKGFYVVVVV